jgi:hypothetical protein
MSAQIIQFAARRNGSPVPEKTDIKERKGAASRQTKAPRDDASFFAFTDTGYGDFMRGRRLAGILIKKADSFALERAFHALVREAMQRAKRGGKRSRRPWTPTNNGFLQAISRYVANGEVLEA